MRVACIGGGPGGLMLALLLRRLGGHHVDVYERSPAGATYGFGVVFSRLSLARLRRAAPDVVSALVDNGARWDDVVVSRDGETSRSSGHGYAAVERRTLLTTLYRLAEEAGAGLHFDSQADAADLLERYDVVVAADGAGSRTRGAFADQLGAKVATRAGRYAWFGVDRAFDAMTFLFADSAHGPLGAHVYPYTEDRSTFLVELGEKAWQSAGFIDGHTQAPGWNDQQAMDFCAEVFADDLGGAKLLGNGSRWLSFPQISAERWSSGRLVALGDAVHTAHFSVGSGTTMALEDAAELARQLARVPEITVREAFAAYESARRPVVEGIQLAAWASLRMWEHPQEHRDLDVGTLMLRLLTRTGQSPADLLLRLDRGLPEATGLPLTPKPEGPVPALVGTGDPAGPEDVLLVAGPGTAESLAPDDHKGPVVVELPSVDADLEGVAELVRALRDTRPDTPVGVLLRAPEPVEEPVRQLVAAVIELADAVPLDVVAVAAGQSPPVENRTAQMVLAERLGAAGLRTAYVCGPGELSQGWTHVQARRTDAVWTAATAV
ncbi:FAD-dependent monooxygenase [Streptomyces sp. NA04227]|uniref:FAD-dependent monooxygenase n=1 Tax=Streptomyces sp. NA04227 TaxID=2742136 RepID=UPI0015912B4B|nr:FAD-dependent monooxygenase [Streptomyces sp. NA04227]QKW06897.1 FAD-dependent monooxygenase [Streptomyces sp. NA04227]